MTRHDELFAASGAAEALLALHGEPVIYRPYGKTPRSIDAIVVREPPATIAEAGSLAARITIKALNNALVGISSAQVDTGRDKLDVAQRQGATATTRSIAGRVRTMGGFTILEIQ